MWPHRVVLPSPSFDQDLGFCQRVADLPVEEFIPPRAVEGFDVPVLPRAPRLDEQRLHLQGLEPEPDELRRELRAVVPSEEEVKTGQLLL